MFPPSVCSRDEVVADEEVAARSRLKGSTSFFLSDFGDLTFEQKKEIMVLHHQQELIKEGKLSQVSPAVSTDTFDIVYNLRILPKL